MTKRNYHEIMDYIRNVTDPDTSQSIAKHIQKIMHFDQNILDASLVDAHDIDRCQESEKLASTSILSHEQTSDSRLTKARFTKLEEAMASLTSKQDSETIMAKISEIMNFTGKPATLSKKRYHEIINFFELQYAHVATQATNVFKDTMRFDPDVVHCTEDDKRRSREYYNRKKATGVSTYIFTGQKNLYYKRKEALNTLKQLKMA